jgi:hypothetical protein
MKLLFVVILHNNENAYKLFSALRKNDTKGTVLPAQSLRSLVLDSEIEPIPMFAGLRHIIDSPRELNYTVFCVIDESELENVKNIVHGVTEEIQQKIGIMFALPITLWKEVNNLICILY